MSSDRARTLAEVIGVSAIVISLVFVGFELKQTRDMNLAELQFNRLSLFHSLMLASLESESVLSASSKTIYTEANGIIWNTPELSELERASLLVRADARIVSWDIEFKIIEAGFAIRKREDLKSEIIETLQLDPSIRAVWPLWDFPGSENIGFYKLLAEALAEANQLGQ